MSAPDATESSEAVAVETTTTTTTTAPEVTEVTAATVLSTETIMSESSSPMNETKTTSEVSLSAETSSSTPLLKSPTLEKRSPAPTTNQWIYISYGTIASLWGLSQVVLIPYVVHLLVLVTAILYAACHMSLQLREEPHPEEKDENGDPVQMEYRDTLKTEDAYQFPIIGSITLFSLYLAFKYLDKDWVNFLIGFYFAIVGCFAITMTIVPALDVVVALFIKQSSNDSNNNNSNNKDENDSKPTHTNRRNSPTINLIDWDFRWNHSLPEFIAGPSPLEVSVAIGVSEVIAFTIAAVVCSLYYYLKRPWYINNILGVCFCLQGIEKFSLGTYKIGAILLVGLFFYDIFWVFGTDVMVTVAKNLDGPIKILFPRARTAEGKLELSLLGLGDIVIPGFFLSLLLRFDAHIAGVGVHYVNVHESFPKPYFHSALAAYVAGLGLTMFVMIYFQAAQPALLYLVPACLGSSFLCAALRGEIQQLLAYTEEQEVVEENNEEKKEICDTTKDVAAKKDD